MTELTAEQTELQLLLRIAPVAVLVDGQVPWARQAVPVTCQRQMALVWFSQS